VPSVSSSVSSGMFARTKGSRSYTSYVGNHPCLDNPKRQTPRSNQHECVTRLPTMPYESTVHASKFAADDIIISFDVIAQIPGRHLAALFATQVSFAAPQYPDPGALVALT